MSDEDFNPLPESHGLVGRAVPTSEDELRAQIAREMSPDSIVASPATIEETRIYFSRMRADLLARVADLESLLGFLESSDDLAVRVAKLEKFCRIGG